MKACSKCGVVHPVGAFSKDSRKKDGLRATCKQCDAMQRISYRSENAAKLKEDYAKWARKNPERLKANKIAWRKSNEDKCNEQRSTWKKEHPDKYSESQFAYRIANRDKVKKDLALWKAANQEACRIHLHNRRARKASNGGRLSKGITEKLFKLQRGKCACGCGEQLGNSYHIDHIMPLALGGTNTDDNIQLLRAICNMQKSAKHPVDFMQQRGFLL